MPPPPPDRRDFLYRDGRRHDGGLGDPLPPAAPTPPRWRDSPYHPPPPPLREYSRPSPRRTPSSASSEGYYRQGAAAYDRPYPDEPLGYTPSRSDRYWLDDDVGAGAGYKGFSRYGGGGGGRRESRDMRGSYRRSPFRGYGSDFSRNHQEHPPPPLKRSPLRSVAVPIYDPSGDRAERGDRDHHPRVTPWRPLRRRESRSDAADASGAGAVRAGQTGAAASSGKDGSARSSAAAAPQVSEDDAPRKKARLGWGQGLAKYEKQKVGPSELAEAVADGSPVAAEQKAATPTHASERCASPVAEPSPAPAPPSPPPPCSSPAREDKSCELTANTVTESNKALPEAEVQACNDEVNIKLDQLEGDPIGSLANVLSQLLQHEDSCSGDSKRLTNTSKLLVLKESITKELEKTELEIDTLEVELKSVNAEAANKALKDSLTTVTYTQNRSPSPVKEQGELTPSPKISVDHDADAKVVELMEMETVEVRNANEVSSEESVAYPAVAQIQASTAADVIPLNTAEGIGSQIDVDNERQEGISCHDNVNSMKAEVSSDLTARPCPHDDNKSNLIPSIVAANHDVAKEASELVFKPLPDDRPHLDLLALSHLSSQGKNDLLIKKKLAIRKTRQRFKEQILTFKFKVLRHLWKEDVRLLSLRKQRSKSNKRTDLNNRALQSGSQRQRSSNRSRLTVPGGNLSTFPITEISDVANKLFSEFQVKRCRNYLKMPALIIDKKEKEGARFVSANGLIADPVSVEKERALINPWTQEEKEVFMEKLATFGKDFSKISRFLQHKTTADCVEFYYKHHKSDSFREVKKLLDLRQEQQPASNYLGAKSGKKWNPETNAASLDMLGVASEVVAAQGLGYANEAQKISAKSIMRSAYGSDKSFVTIGSDKDHVGTLPLHERESVAADVLAGICGTLSPEGMGSCITSSADPGQKIGIARMDHLVADEDGTLSDQECEVDAVDWNDHEKSIFIEAFNRHGKDFGRISSCVKSKSYEQCKVFFSKARISLGLDLIHQGTADVGLPTSDTNGGRSDTDGACAAEMDSAMCSPQSCSKMEMDICPAADGATQGHSFSGIASEEPEADKSNGPDAVDVKFEVDESKVEKDCSTLVDHKLSSEATHQESCAAHIDINCPETTEKLLETKEVNPVNTHHSDAVASSTVLAEVAHLETKPTLHSVEVIEPSKASEGICTDVSRMEERSHHAHGNAIQKAGKYIPSICLQPANGGSKENIINFSNVASVSSIRPAFTSSYQHNMPADRLQSKSKPQVTPLTPKDLMPVQFSSSIPDPTSICFEGIASITSPNFEDHRKRLSNASGVKGMNTFQTFEDRSGNQHDVLFRNINGYMQHRPKNHLATEVAVSSESTVSGTAGVSQRDKFTLSTFQNDRSNSVGLSTATLGILSTGNREEAREGLLRPCSQKASTESDEQLKRPGDVKLFGKILSHQSSLQSSASTSNGCKSKPPSPKIDRSAGMLLSNSRDHVVYPSRPPITAHMGLEGSVRSYAHLDGNAVQTESMLMVAKRQRSLAGVPFYSAKNGTLNVFSEYQQPSVQPLPTDHQKRLDSFADLQKTNGIELISGFQQPGKGSRLGGAGILVSGVSDPVAVLKAQYGPAPKILSNDVDPWKDIGRR